jgi:hypothetical protein
MRFVSASTSFAALATALLNAVPAHATEAAPSPPVAAAPDAAAPDIGTEQNAITVTARHRNEKMFPSPSAPFQAPN